MNKMKRVLIADDDTGILDSISMMLEYAGYQVSTTVNGASLLSMDKAAIPDLFLLDIWMSGVDGRDICKELKLKEATKQIPVLLLSASKDIQHSALEAGADDFIAKPFEMDELLEKVGKYTSEK